MTIQSQTGLGGVDPVAGEPVFHSATRRLILFNCSDFITKASLKRIPCYLVRTFLSFCERLYTELQEYADPFQSGFAQPFVRKKRICFPGLGSLAGHLVANLDEHGSLLSHSGGKVRVKACSEYVDMCEQITVKAALGTTRLEQDRFPNTLQRSTGTNAQ